MKIGSNVIIDTEAMVDSNLTDNKGIVLDLWNEPIRNTPPTPLAKILLDDGTIGVVGQHEIQTHNLKYDFKKTEQEFDDAVEDFFNE